MCVCEGVLVGCNGARVRIVMMRWFLLTGEGGKESEGKERTRCTHKLYGA